MIIDENFIFKTSVSVDAYHTKAESTACLNIIGAKATGKSKMAFLEKSVTASEFLELATSGHTFCNLFKYDKDTKYWIGNSGIRHFLSYPVYRRGSNAGAMKLSFKSDEFFYGSQTVFVDIDYTAFSDVLDYIRRLRYPPTLVYMSYSDKKEKNGIASRRFRLVYVIDRIAGKDEFARIARHVSKAIEGDTGEVMEDDCGTRPSQFMNGVYDNPETYCSNCIYSPSDFPPDIEESPAGNEEEAAVQQESVQQVEFDSQMLYEMNNMPYAQFMHYYSTKYSYFYRTEKAEWINGQYQITDEGYLQLWFYTRRQVDGEKRRCKLFKNACLRRIMQPNIDANALLFNIYVDSMSFFDNSDGVITIDTLARKVSHAMSMTGEQLAEYCKQDVAYWKKNRPEFIIKNGVAADIGTVNKIRREITWNNLDDSYDRSASIISNMQRLDISRRTMYRYCTDRGIDTHPEKGLSEAEKRASRRASKWQMVELFKKLYDPSLSIRSNKENMEENGLSIAIHTISSWAKKYYDADEIFAAAEEYSPCLPSFDPFSPFGDADFHEGIGCPRRDGGYSWGSLLNFEAPSFYLDSNGQWNISTN